MESARKKISNSLKKTYHKMSRLSLVVLFFSTVLVSCKSSETPQEAVVTNSLCYQLYCPTGGPKNNVIVNHQIYLLSLNRRTKFADWVAYVVRRDNLHGPSRKRAWKKDPTISAVYTLSPKDYRGASKVCGYDRGHQAPLASFSNNPHWATTNYLSNITPQKSALNRGPWVRLESAIRRLAAKGQAAYVVTGLIYTDKETMCPLPSQPSLHIPNAYFKVIFQSNDGVVEYAAFIMPQDAARKINMCQYAVTLQVVRDKTKLRFLKTTPNNMDERLLQDLGC